MDFSQAVLDFSRRDLRSADGLCWEARHEVEGTNTIHLIHARNKPRGRKTTYLNSVANVHPQKEDPYCIRYDALPI